MASLLDDVSSALGPRVAGILGNDQRLIDKLIACSGETGETLNVEIQLRVDVVSGKSVRRGKTVFFSASPTLFGL